MPTTDILLIIGNGFDMDLGLRTSYQDFVNSNKWPCKTPLFKVKDHILHQTKCLNDYLYEHTNINLWYDLENILGKYACNPPGNSTCDSVKEETLEQANIDKSCYDKLVVSLTAYLNSEQSKELKHNSVASRVLKLLLSQQLVLSIYSFNYTDLNLLASKLGITEGFKTAYVHGNLKDGIVLGIEGNLNFCWPYRYMCKEYNRNYKSTYLINELRQCSYVIIFGHSLSSIDYHYFKNFFSKQSSVDLDPENRKVITIFTYDQESDWDIRDQLRRMNNKRLDMLFANNDFRIIHTDGTDEGNVKKFLEEISQLGIPRGCNDFCLG